MIEHIVCLYADRSLLTENLRRDILELAGRVREECRFPVENEVTFSEPAFGSVTAVFSHWHFRNREELERFRESRAHQEHLKRIHPALLDRHSFDREG